MIDGHADGDHRAVEAINGADAGEITVTGLLTVFREASRDRPQVYPKAPVADVLIRWHDDYMFKGVVGRIGELEGGKYVGCEPQGRSCLCGTSQEPRRSL